MANSLSWISGGPGSPVPDLFWAKFNEGAGTAFADSSVEGHNGTINQISQWITLSGGFAINNNGTSDFAKTTGSVAYNAFSVITISFWIKINGGLGSLGIILESSANYNTASPTWIVYITGDGSTITFGTSSSVSSAYMNFTVVATGINNGAWHNVLWYCDQSSVVNNKVFFDTLSQTKTPVLDDGIPTNFSTQPLFMASRASTSLFSAIGLDDVRIYSGDQSASVVAIFNDHQ